MALSLGTSGNNNNGGGGLTPISITLTTAGSSGVLVFAVMANEMSGLQTGGSVSSTTLGSWGSARVTSLQASGFATEIFTKAFTSTLTSEVITYTPGIDTAFQAAIAFEVNGCAATSYFDTNGGLPAVNPTNPADPVSISTSNANDFIFAFARMNTVSAPTSGAGWMQINTGFFCMAEYMIVSSTQSGLSATIGTGSGDSNVMIGDAIIAAGGGSPTLLPYVETWS